MIFSIPASHPSLPGHFPGQPVVPAVVILDAVVGLLGEHCPGSRLAGVVSAKFTAILLPEQICHVRFEHRADGLIRFECREADRAVASGLLTIREPVHERG
jgi:3-hydroxymyristoyl/3-hydroxydecanoyl-(acyl carrier protein) dehydratase